ncbi:DinB family protein [Allomuricauda sp. M10]|uniref:DinB family protein n=1 Tax=Allomuricauda sp. M10 TaxID=2683292 RepID=UPI001D1878B9|nr:DinB family protein [Muricauda sp. M10]
MEITQLKSILWSQFGASIDMLHNAIERCPEAVWNKEKKFWYNAYHCIFFLDYYLTLDTANYAPPPPFDESEFEDRMPERTYTKVEVLDYLNFCRDKCKTFISGLSEDLGEVYWINQSKTMDYNVIEILLYNMRHVQHHAAQLNLILRQEIDDAPDWEFQVKDRL